ncbi:neprilysin-4-like [Asterias rubens]|uniref:neprilysin-4-like n=1 Tax=Asterias rubens TaxID=7604 RepID=UPI001454FC46|nr:neprilysin-4-like [Asterias rubens]
MDGIVTKPNSVHWKRPSWYRRRTGLERRLLWLSVLLGFVAISLVAVLMNELLTDKKVSERVIIPDLSAQCAEQKVCLTEGCVEAAAGLLVNMNTNADPCEDFYEYACGGWVASRVIPEEESNLDVLKELTNRLELKCRGLISSKVKEDDPPSNVKAKHLFQACMNEDKINERGYEPLRAKIKLWGGWPLMNDSSFDESTWNLEDFLAKIVMETGGNYLIRTYIGVDPQNSGEYIMFISQPTSVLNRNDYTVANFSHRNVVTYREYIEAVAIELSSGSDDEVRHQVDELLHFEAALSGIQIPVNTINAATMYRRLSTKDLLREAPEIDWERYFGNIVNPNLKETELVGTFTMDYMKRLGPLLEATPTRTIANFLMWMLVKDSMALLGRKPRKLGEEFAYQVMGEQAEKARWKQCFSLVKHYMNNVMSALFVEEYFDEQSKFMMTDLLHDIREIQLETLNQTDWMDESTKAKSIEKALAVRELIGYADKVKNQTLLELEYENMISTPDSHFENVFAAMRNYVRVSLGSFRRPVDFSRWPDKLTTFRVSALYEYALNRITFPAGIIQHPFFNSKNPRSMNYGGIGFVIGHELMHGFDNTGRSFDKSGNLEKVWSDGSIQAFHDKTSCLVEQYSNYTVDQVGRKVNGKQTLGENIADNSGLMQAFRAYRRWVARNRAEEAPLPGINVTHNQLFFLNFGQIFCSIHRDQSIIHTLQSNKHSPSKFRVLGSVTNSHAFAEAFKCKSNSPMNPEEKCSVY